MTSSHPLPAPCQWFARLASALDRRSAPRLAWLFLGAILVRDRPGGPEAPSRDDTDVFVHANYGPDVPTAGQPVATLR